MNKKRLSNDIVNSMFNICIKLFELLELKGIDSKRYIDEFRSLFSLDSENIKSLLDIIEISDYGSVDKLFSKIKKSGNKVL